MEFQFLGTAAAEGIPALFCNCENCTRSRKIGGRALRTRSQAIIDGKLLIDFPADTYAHILQNHIDLLQVTACLVTHTHADHFYPQDLAMIQKGYAYYPEDYRFRVYGSDKVGRALAPFLTPQILQENCLSFTEIQPYTPFQADDYTITALPGLHDPGAGPLFYMISDGRKTVLYAHDTHFFPEEIWEYFARVSPHFDLVSLDCTNVCRPMSYIGHMSLAENVQIRRRMLEMGIASEETRFFCNHFSHNGIHAVYDDFLPIAAAEGFGISYDGMKVTV